MNTTVHDSYPGIRYTPHIVTGTRLHMEAENHCCHSHIRHHSLWDTAPSFCSNCPQYMDSHFCLRMLQFLIPNSLLIVCLQRYTVSHCIFLYSTFLILWLQYLKLHCRDSSGVRDGRARISRLCRYVPYLRYGRPLDALPPVFTFLRVWAITQFGLRMSLLVLVMGLVAPCISIVRLPFHAWNVH